MYLSKITGNVKEGVEAQLGPRTLIVGENGAGKSSIINAIELALGGFASDVNGRTIVRKTSDLITLKGTPQNGEKSSKTLSVSGVLSDGSKCGWQCNKTPTGAGKAKHSLPQGLVVRFPFQEVKENLTGSANTARQYLLSVLPTDRYLENIPENVKAELEAQKKAKPDIPLGDHLTTVVEIAKRRIKDAKAEIKARGITKELIGKDMVPTTADEVERAKSQCAVHLSSIVNQGKQIAIQEVETAKVRALHLAEEVVRLDEALAHGEPQALTSQEEGDRHILALMQSVCEYHETNNRNTCIVCDHSLERAPSSEEIKAVLESYQQRADATMVYNQLLAKKDSTYERAEEALHKWEALNAQLEEQGSDNDAEVLYTQARKAYERLNENWKKQNQLAELNEQVEALEATLAEATQLKEDAEKTAQEVLTEAIDAFEDSVTKFLPHGRKFTLDLGKNHCRLGMTKFNELRYAVSGAEYNMMILAIASAISNVWDQTDTLNIFIPEERAYDRQTLWSMMDALKDVNGQVLITTTETPQPHEKWGLVEVNSIPF